MKNSLKGWLRSEDVLDVIDEMSCIVLMVSRSLIMWKYSNKENYGKSGYTS
jgi:hypothetical protein